MDSISQAVTCRASLYHQGVADCIDCPETGYRYMLASDVYGTLLPIFGAAMTHCPTLASATQMTAGSLYHDVYAGLTGRTARARDCVALDRLECMLLYDKNYR